MVMWIPRNPNGWRAPPTWPRRLGLKVTLINAVGRHPAQPFLNMKSNRLSRNAICHRDIRHPLYTVLTYVPTPPTSARPYRCIPGCFDYAQNSISSYLGIFCGLCDLYDNKCKCILMLFYSPPHVLLHLIVLLLLFVLLLLIVLDRKSVV